MNLRLPAPKAGALPGCATPRTFRKAYHFFVRLGRGIRQVLVPTLAAPRKSVGFASRRPNSAGHTILKYAEASSKNRQPHVSEERFRLRVSVRSRSPPFLQALRRPRSSREHAAIQTVAGACAAPSSSAQAGVVVRTTPVLLGRRRTIGVLLFPPERLGLNNRSRGRANRAVGCSRHTRVGP